MPAIRATLAEGVGTALLLTVVIGSGIMAERLSPGNGAIALLANTLATVGGLYVLIETLGPVSGAHFNPAVTGVSVVRGQTPRSLLLPYLTAQLFGALLGAWLANAMFEVRILQTSGHVRDGWGQWLAEVVATAGLVFVVLRAPPNRVAMVVAAYIGCAYWFTSSTSFANPAATFGRMFSDSFAGIAPRSAPGFVIAESLGAAVGYFLDSVFAAEGSRGGAVTTVAQKKTLGALGRRLQRRRDVQNAAPAMDRGPHPGSR